jgi:hypothetical protein
MKTVFDQVNYAQNQFGVSIEGTLQGLAKASGSFRNAGGDINQLLALIALGQKITGQTGDVQGTAFQRIPNYLNQANNQATLRQFGINPGGNVTDILNEAIKKSASGKLDRDQVRQLATSIFGKFYGPRVGVPLLNNPARAQQYISQLRPGGPSQGSGEKELQTLLGSIQERIKAIGTQLQIMGDNLTGTHLLDFFGLVVIALGQALKFTNFLVEGFDQLPDGVKRTLSYLLEGLIVLRAMQRLQVGELIAPAGGGSSARRQRIGNFLGTGETPQNQVRLVRRAQALETEHFQEQFTQATSQGLEATNRGRIAQQQMLAAQQDHAKLIRAGSATQDDITQSQRRINSFAQESANASATREGGGQPTQRGGVPPADAGQGAVLGPALPSARLVLPLLRSRQPGDPRQPGRALPTDHRTSPNCQFRQRGSRVRSPNRRPVHKQRPARLLPRVVRSDRQRLPAEWRSSRSMTSMQRGRGSGQPLARRDERAARSHRDLPGCLRRCARRLRKPPVRRQHRLHRQPGDQQPDRVAGVHLR